VRHWGFAILLLSLAAMGGSAGWLYFEHVKQEKEQKRRLWNILTHDRYSTLSSVWNPDRLEWKCAWKSTRQSRRQQTVVK